MLMLTVLTQKDRSIVLVIRDTQEMESRVLVRNYSHRYLSYFLSKRDHFIFFLSFIFLLLLWFNINSIVTRLQLMPIIILDIDECHPNAIPLKYRHLSHNCHADSNCTNTKGSFYCTCLVGYSGDGVNCVGMRLWFSSLIDLIQLWLNYLVLKKYLYCTWIGLDERDEHIWIVCFEFPFFT
jgi:hypothetical protein